MTSCVSIIIPVFNGELYLRNSIDSALNQSYSNTEIIVINDGSTDGSAAILESYGTTISVISQPNKGLGASRNAGIRAAKGAFIAFLDADDIWLPTKLQLQMDAMQRTSDDPLLFTMTQQFICPSLSYEEQQHLVVTKSPVPGYIASSLLLSRKRWNTIGSFTEEKKLGEFIEWFLRVQEQKIPHKLLSEIGFYRRIHRTNMGRQKSTYQQSDYLHILQASLNRRRQCQ